MRNLRGCSDAVQLLEFCLHVSAVTTLLFRCYCYPLKKVSPLQLEPSQTQCCFAATLNVLLYFQKQPQHSTAGNLRALLCQVLSRYLAHPGATGGSMAANIHHTFCSTNSSLLESFAQEFRTQLSQVSDWDLPWGLQLGAVAVHTCQAGFGSCSTAPRGQELLLSVPKCKQGTVRLS